MKKQLTQLMPTLVVMVLILALTVATYNISLRQEEEECFNRLENASETMVQSIKNRVNDDLNYLRLIGKDFSNERRTNSVMLTLQEKPEDFHRNYTIAM